MVSSEKGDVPRDFISYWENIPLSMKVLPHAYLAEADDCHNTDIEGEHRTALLVTRNHWNAKAFGGYSVRLEALGLCVTLDV
jgi:hypothetical protein